MNTKPAVDRKTFNLSLILNFITIISFLITIGVFVYTSGQKNQKILQQEERITALETKLPTVYKQLNTQNDETVKVNAKLSLLLDYFHIADAPVQPAQPVQPH
jgi:Na+-translocating ferredoxin:NAD+ oxidoreductase RnfG subunit